MGTVELRLTDAPSDEFESATVFVSQVSVMPSGSGAAATVSSTATAYDLLTLQNGVTAMLGTASIATGTYNQVRLIVDSARVVLAAGRTFAGGSSTASLRVPSGSESGLKINFSGPVTIDAGKTVLLVDFDVSRSFVLQGQTSAPTGISFKPVLHALAQDVAASISGVITPASSQATVYAVAGTDTVQTAFADAATGAYTLRYLPPGTYVIAAAATGFHVNLSAPVVVANAQNVIGIDLTLVALP